jgi:tellurite resistance protein TerC
MNPLSWLPWAAFAVVISAMLAIDLGLLQRSGTRRPREPDTRMALAWSAAWFTLAMMFGSTVAVAYGPDRGLEFFTAYFVEQALSVDNLFVMMLVFARFRVPRALQRRVLSWGIAGVVVLRGILIVSGTELVAQFHVLTYVLGALLLAAAVKLAREIGRPSERGDGDPAATPGASRIRSLVARVLPITDDFVGSRFTVVRAGVRHATPLLLALVTIEVADAVFALDSIPAVLGVTTDRFIVFTSNLFAVLGLRSLFFALSGLLDRLCYLKHGLVGVLGLVGTKMLLAMWWPAPTWLSLALITLVLGGAVVASLVVSPITKDSHAEES